MAVVLDEYQGLFLALSLLSLIFFLGSLAAVPWLVGQLPEDYFLDPGSRPGSKMKGRLLWAGMRNLSGALVFLMGVVMLFVPGQGVLTMVAGLILMEFPGKRRLIRYATGFSQVRSGLNWLRRKREKPPLKFPEHGEG